MTIDRAKVPIALVENGVETGRVEVRNGRFYVVPLFGSLRAALTEESPEFGKDVAKSLKAG